MQLNTSWWSLQSLFGLKTLSVLFQMATLGQGNEEAKNKLEEKIQFVSKRSAGDGGLIQIYRYFIVQMVVYIILEVKKILS